MLLSLLLTPSKLRTGSFRLLIVMIICENQELGDDQGGVCDARSLQPQPAQCWSGLQERD